MNYYLLPFRFERLGDYEILVNEVGDYLICLAGTSKRIVERQVSENDELYKDLISNHFISTKPIPKLVDNLAARYRTKKAFLDNFTALHIFVMTIRCNQNCLYCQASSKECNQTIYDISYETLDYGINLMFQSPSPHLTMEFQGGEPTLVFDKIEYAIEKCEKINDSKNKHIIYVICTNSVSLSSDMLSLCKKYNVLISTSLDGPEFVHNQNRGKKDSYEKVLCGIKNVRNELGDNKVSALMTTSRLSLNYPKEIVDSYIENGFSNIFLRSLNPYGLVYENDNWDDYYSQFIEFYKISLDYIIKKNKEGIYFEESFTTLILKKILTPFSIGFVDLQSPAGLINSVVVYNYDGYVYASDESRMLAEHEDFTFRLGSVKDRYLDLFYGKKTLEIANTWANESLAGCSDCAFQAYCGADPVRNYTTQNDMEGFRPTSFLCKKNKSIIKHIFSLIINRNEEVMPVFKSWLNNN
ncbi:His-Xaa-Ser system radical SAM maturase HxsB [uncultured Acetobacteroides sp.]|uniref:His-Xaa-Ser system radical SAM maturase HxsB n=1 Tax=uncultured Acetobacteroides sp. TaxID=1760811 RepID=UPI0029F498FD|nr:His-Xaa-Ser system radical SAM maturase HxsB [uncultured Acetobacteroides sp.]